MAISDPNDSVNPYAPPKAELGWDEVGRKKMTGIDLSVENPFLTIWLRPRATIRGILDSNPGYLVIPLAMAGGVIQTLDRAAQRDAGDQMPLAGILILALVLGPISGLIGVYLGGAMLGWAGRKLGGHGASQDVRAALAWSEVPVLATIPLWILQLAVVGHEMFTSNTPVLDSNPGIGMVLLVTGLIELVLAFWFFVTMLKCLGEAHGFSAWKALGSLLFLTLLIAIPVVILVMILIGLR
jgi:hypothetical protein